jgi:hypothetical protein
MKSSTDCVAGKMRMDARRATKVVAKTTTPRSATTQTPHFAATRRDGACPGGLLCRSACQGGLAIGFASLRASHPGKPPSQPRGTSSEVPWKYRLMVKDSFALPLTPTLSPAGGEGVFESPVSRQVTKPKRGAAATRSAKLGVREQPHKLRSIIANAALLPLPAPRCASPSPGRPSFWLLFLGETRKSNQPPGCPRRI